MYPTIFSILITFPFAQLGWGLRWLSLSGAAGNILAIAVYILICLSPFALCWRLKRTGKLLKSDLLLPVQSILLFVTIYYMINPGLFRTHVPGTEKLLLGSTFYSVFFGYIILRILEICRTADARGLKLRLKTLFAAVIFLFFCIIFAECGANLFTLFQCLKDADAMTGTDLTMTYFFFVLQCITNTLPYALAVFILFSAVRSLNELLTDRYSDASVASVDRLALLCTRSLVAAVLSSISFNILQLMFHRSLLQINVVVSVPVFSIAFVLIILLAAKYIRENQRLKRDNDLFI